jgi:regulator of sirC expression with transglutaminase-like and TPR domain
MSTQPDGVRLFARMMEKRDPEVPLTEAALVIAQTEYPGLDIAAQLERFRHLAARLRPPRLATPSENIRAINQLLYSEEGFEGNDEEYDDPRNSYLNDVLDRKKGLPITLSIVYMDVAIRKSLPVEGVGFPRHFLVKYLAPDGEIFLDPYHSGASLSLEDCAERLRTQYGEAAKMKPEYLAACSPKQILARMLNNLKGSYFRGRNYGRVLTLIEMSSAIEPASLDPLRDRGMVYLQMNRHREASADFNAYLERCAPDDPGAKDVLQALRRIQSLMN